MADLERTIQLIFGADNNIGPVAADIDAQLGGLNDIVQGVAAPLADLAEKIIGVNKVLLALGAALAGLAFNEAVKLESALADLQKQLGDADPPITELETAIRSLSNQFGISSTVLITAVADLKQANFSTAESFDVLRSSIDLQIAGGLDAAQATDVLVRTLNGFKAEASDAAEVVSVLNAGSGAYATSTQELAIGLASISGAAGGLNLTYADTADLLIGIIQVFGSGSEAANALRTGFSALLNPTEKAGTAIESLTGKLFDANDETQNARDFIFQFAGAFSKLNDAQQLQIASIIFGSEQSVRLREAFNGIADSSVNVAEAMGRVSSVQEEVNIRLATTEVTIQRAIVAFQNLAQTVGKEYRDELKGVIDATGEFAQALDSAIASGALDELFDLLEPQLKALEDTIRAIAKNLPAALEDIDFTNVVEAFERLGIQIGDIFEGFFGDIDLTTVSGLQKALQGVADAFAGLINLTAGIAQAFVPFFSAIGEAIRNLSELDAESQQTIGRILGVAKIIIDFGTSLGLAFVAIASAGLDMARVMDVVFAGIRVLINGTQIGFQELAGNILLVIANIAEVNAAITFGELSDKFTELANNLRGAAGIIGEDVARNYKELETAQNDLASAFDRNNPKYAESEQRLKDLDSRLRSSKPALDDFAKSQGQAGDSVEEFGDSFKQVSEQITADYIQKLTDDNKGLAKSFAGLNDILAKNKKAQEGASDAARGYRIVLGEFEGQPVASFEQVGGKLATSFNKTGEAAKEATEKSGDFLLKMEEIASNERIALIEAKVELNIANLEADTRRVEAAFESINASVTSTGDVISSALDSLGAFANQPFGGLFSPAFKLVKEQLETENRLRSNAFELQRELTQATVENLRARSAALRRGDALLTIKGEGLSPHIKAFMFEILEEIQTEMNAELQEFLLGVSPA